MNVQFLLFVIAILLVLIFWELSKINSRLNKDAYRKKQDYEWAKKDPQDIRKRTNIKNRENPHRKSQTED